MPAETCTEEEIRAMVIGFYDRIRADAVLGPIFERHIQDWETHLNTMCDFWSSLLLRTARFKGAPVPRHLALPDLNADLFRHWLQLFTDHLADNPNPWLAERATLFAQRIAQRLWLSYQIGHFPDQEPNPFPESAQRMQ